MRALRVLGLSDSGDLVLTEANSEERFSLRRDDSLRAAVRGDLSQLGQLSFSVHSQLRPKDIQSRIRAGASVDEVAALAGTSTIRVERFAHPVLLERVTMAERARRGRPSIDGIAAGTPLEDTVGTTLAVRGQDGPVVWDAYKHEGDWVLALTWQAGRSENTAHWTFHPGPDGGTLTARDDNAAEMVDPALRIGRPLREVTHRSAPQRDLAPTSGAPGAAPTAAPGESLIEQTVIDERSGARLSGHSTPIARTGTDSSSARPLRRSGRPSMPSWEDVLLGTRSEQS